MGPRSAPQRHFTTGSSAMQSSGSNCSPPLRRFGVLQANAPKGFFSGEVFSPTNTGSTASCGRRRARGTERAAHGARRRSQIADRRSQIADRRSQIADRRSQIADRRSKTADRSARSTAVGFLTQARPSGPVASATPRGGEVLHVCLNISSRETPDVINTMSRLTADVVFSHTSRAKHLM